MCLHPERRSSDGGACSPGSPKRNRDKTPKSQRRASRLKIETPSGALSIDGLEGSAHPDALLFDAGAVTPTSLAVPLSASGQLAALLGRSPSGKSRLHTATTPRRSNAKPRAPRNVRYNEAPGGSAGGAPGGEPLGDGGLGMAPWLVGHGLDEGVGRTNSMPNLWKPAPDAWGAAPPSWRLCSSAAANPNER